MKIWTMSQQKVAAAQLRAAMTFSFVRIILISVYILVIYHLYLVLFIWRFINKFDLDWQERKEQPRGVVDSLTKKYSI